MEKLMTAKECSAIIGRAHNQVLRVAKKYNIGVLDSNRRMFTAEEIEKVKNAFQPHGRPTQNKKQNFDALPSPQYKPDAQYFKSLMSPPNLIQDGSIASVRIQDEFSKYIQNQVDIQKQELIANEIARSKIATQKERAVVAKEEAAAQQQEMKAKQMKNELVERKYAEWLFLGQSKVMCQQLTTLFQRHKTHLIAMMENKDPEGMSNFFQTRISEIIEQAKKFCIEEAKKIGSEYDV